MVLAETVSSQGVLGLGRSIILTNCGRGRDSCTQSASHHCPISQGAAESQTDTECLIDNNSYGLRGAP